MTKKTCPLGEDCDLTVAWMAGRESAKEEYKSRIEELEAKLAESEAWSKVLETLVMDVAADLYEGVAAHRIDQRIMDAIGQLDEEEEEDQ